MKKILSFVLVVVFLMSGCSLFKKDPQKAVTEGVAKFANVEKMSYSLSVKGTVREAVDEQPSVVQLNFSMSGKTDGSDEKNPKTDSQISFESTQDGVKSGGRGQIRLVDKKMFLNIGSIQVVGQSEQTLSSVLSGFLNTWWSISASEESGPLKSFLDEEGKMTELLKNAKLFINAREEGEEDVQGVNAVKYRVDLDKTELKKLIVDIGRMSDNVVSPSEEAAIEESMKNIEFSGAVWIGDDDVLHRAAGALTITPQEGPLSATSLEIDFKAWDYGKAVTVSAPEGAKEFNSMMLMPILGALGSLEEGTSAVPAEEEAVVGTSAE